jgi:hypothetical protein
MKRLSALLTVLLIAMFQFSCSGDHGPISPLPNQPSGLTAETSLPGGSQTHLWGFYTIYIDVPSQTATAVLDRQAMFTANVVNFLNGKPTNLGFHINKTPVGTGYIDVDIDVTMTHPFPGLTQYNGYDVRGVFMGDGSASMAYNPKLVYPIQGTDQYMFNDPELPTSDYGAPDGYTRWFNKTEFLKGGMPLFQYTQGKVATPGYNPTATLCPYKYFADNLNKNDDLWTWLNDPSNENPTGVFGAGQANTRNYYLRFPNSKGVKFGYAVVATWKGTAPEDHPANAPEAIALNVVDNSNIYYKDSSTNGGNLILDLSIWDWDSIVVGGVMEDYKLIIESTVLSAPYQFLAADMTPIGGGENYSTYHIEIPADNVMKADGNEYWVIAECANLNYSNDFGVPNDASTDPLAAFFRYPIETGSAVPPVAIAKIASSPPYTSCQAVHFMDDGSYDPDGTITKYEWDWDNDGTFDEEGSDVYHTFGSGGIHDVQFRVTDNDGFTDILDIALQLSVTEVKGWAKTWGGPFIGPDYSNDQSRGLAFDSSGNIYVVGQFQGNNVDLDPSPTGNDPHSSNGGLDAFLIKFDGCGGFIWARTWGGTGDDTAWGTIVDSNDNVIVQGSFAGTVDFDPGTPTDMHSINGEGDCFLSKFDSSGSFIWARTWGCTSYDNPYSIALGLDDAIYFAGEWFYGPIDLNPDPVEVDNHPLIGASDRYLSKFDSTGDYLWGQSWGGALWDGGAGIDSDSMGGVYVLGHYRGVVDFDPDPVGVDNISCVNYPAASGVVSKFDTTGDYKWARLLTGAVPSGPSGVWVNDSDTYCYISGAYNGVNADFDPGTGTDNHSSNGDDAFLTVFDLSGNFQWAKTWGGTQADSANGVGGDGSGNIVVCGRFQSPGMDFDPGTGNDPHSPVGGYDWFVSRFDPSGAFQWAQTWGAAGDDNALATACDSTGGILTVGFFTYTVDFDPGTGVDNHTALQTQDAYLFRIGSDGNW